MKGSIRSAPRMAAFSGLLLFLLTLVADRSMASAF